MGYKIKTNQYGLSKSKIMAGLQCPRRLYFEIHNPELADQAGSEYAFTVGNLVGETARTLFPDGHLIGHDKELSLALEETATCVKNIASKALFEATFEHDGVLVRVDVLRAQGDSVELIEVKASTSVKDHYLNDCAIQAWVLENAGISPAAIKLAHINNTFIHSGDGNYEGLFTFADVTKKIGPLKNKVDGWVSELRNTLAGQQEPDIEVGDHCREPYDCPFMNYCWPTPPEYPVTLLPRGGREARALQDEGYSDLRDVPPGRLTHPNFERIWRATTKGEAELLPGADEVLQTLPYPHYFLDFETVAFAVPIWAGTRPYEALPFQWSCHIEHTDGSLEHVEFLDTSGAAPMRSLAKQLIATLGEKGAVFMYSPFERRIIRELAARFPDLAEALEPIVDRLFDLLPLVREHYYHPDMKGSWSIKAVLPTIAPDLKYDELDEIQDGMAASSAYMEIVSGQMNTEDRTRTTEALLEYCKLDTLAMVRLVKFLQ